MRETGNNLKCLIYSEVQQKDTSPWGQMSTLWYAYGKKQNVFTSMKKQPEIHSNNFIDISQRASSQERPADTWFRVPREEREDSTYRMREKALFRQLRVHRRKVVHTYMYICKEKSASPIIYDLTVVRVELCKINKPYI